MMMVVTMTIMTEAHKPISSGEFRCPHSMRIDHYFGESAEVFRFPHQKFVGPFLANESVSLSDI